MAKENFVIVTWKVLESLLNEMKKKFEEEIDDNLKETVEYYYISTEKRFENPDFPTLGYSLQKRLEEIDKNKKKIRYVAENSIYKDVCLPAKQKENKKFSTRRKLYPNVFFEYINCLGVEDFLEKCKIGKYKLGKEAIEEQEKLLNKNIIKEEAKNIVNHRFNCYFSNEEEGIFESTLTFKCLPNEDIPTKAILAFSRFGEENIYQSLLLEWGENISITLKGNNSESDYVLFSLYKGPQPLTRKAYMYGTYSGFDNKSTPVAGELLIERYKEGETYHPFVKKYLLGKRIKSKRDVMNHISQLPDREDNEFIEKYLQGTYMCFFMEDYEKINKARLTINLDGTIKYESCSNVIFKCELSFFNYKRYVVIRGTGKSRGFCFQFVFRTTDLKTENRLIGVQGGIGANIVKPKGGRIAAFKVLKNDQPKDFLEVGFVNVKKNKYKKISKHISSKYNLDLTALLSGNLDKYIDQKNVFESIENIQVLDSKLRRYVASYDLYFLSSKKRALRKYMVKLHEDGTAALKGRNDYWGRFDKYKMNLIISLKHQNKPMAQITCFVGDVYNFHKATGIFSSITDKGAPYSMLCVLVKKGAENQVKEGGKHNSLGEHEDYEGFKFDSKGIKVGSEEFTKLDKEYKGIGTFLSDKYTNTIKTRRSTLEEDEKFEAETIISKKIFNSACYLSLEGKSKEKVEAELKLSYDGGYNDLTRIQNECKEDGALYKHKKTVYEIWKLPNE